MEPDLLDGYLLQSDEVAVAVDGVPLYRDDNHLSLRGNVLIADLFESVFEPGAE